MKVNSSLSPRTEGPGQGWISEKIAMVLQMVKMFLSITILSPKRATQIRIALIMITGLLIDDI